MPYCYERLKNEQKITDIPIIIAIFTYMSFAMLYIMGHFRDFLMSIGLIRDNVHLEGLPKGFAPLLPDFESFFTRNLYGRLIDCWNRPISSCPGVKISVMRCSRNSLFEEPKPDGRLVDAINMGSYNYLGFGDPNDLCSEFVESSIREYGISTCASIKEFGYLSIHQTLEREVASFVGKEAAICFSMGFATNSSNLQALLTSHSCIISDELNHASLVLASRLCNCKIFTFRHNDMDHLESILRDVISQGRIGTHRDWDKIIVLVEGIYSMEGTFINLPKIIQLKKKYKFYLYLDEAHSIGCSGLSGRGVTSFFDIDPKDVDIMMGTFTKSFGSCGGYIAADKRIVNYIRKKSFCTYHGASMAPAVAAQIIAALRILNGEIGINEGANRLKQLRKNILYFRTQLKEMGLIIYGHDSSPVVPILIYIPGKLGRMMLERKVAVVVVGFPATSILCSRARFCISSAHTKEMLDQTLKAIDEVSSLIGIKYNS